MAKRKLLINAAMMAVCIFLGVVVALQYKGIQAKKNIESQESKTLTEAQAKIINIQLDNESLRSEIAELKYQVDMLEQGANDQHIEYLRQQLKQVMTIAGLTDVKGKGLVITLTFELNTRSENQENALKLIINELRASNAQAISVNGERLAAMSEIRAAGEFVIINNKTQSAPYEIKVIGEPKDIQNALNMPGGAVQAIGFYKCTASIQTKEEVVISKVGENVNKVDLLNDVE